MSEAEIERLPDPDLLWDAMFLRDHGSWTATVLDDTDALLVALVKRLYSPVKRG